MTSLLVKHWDDHYVAITKDATSNKHANSEPTSGKSVDTVANEENKSPSRVSLSFLLILNQIPFKS